MATTAAVTCLAWLGLVHIVLVAGQGQSNPDRPAAFVISPDSPVKEVYCRSSGLKEFTFSEATGPGELTVRVQCPRRGFLPIRLPVPPDFQAELTQSGATIPKKPIEPLSLAQQYRMVAFHNFHRSVAAPSAQKMYQLEYKPDLARSAEAWVGRCAEGLEGSGLGENVAKLTKSVPANDALDLAFQTWVTHPITERQMLVDDSKTMGCAHNPNCRDFSGEFTLVACYYEKADQRPNELYPYVEGPACSQCSKCYNRLCQA